MGLTDRLRTLFPAIPSRSMWTADDFAPIGGRLYPLGLQQTLVGPEERVGRDFTGYATNAYGGNGVVFACLNARLALFTQARFMWRQLRSGTPGDLWSSPELDILRTPWPNGTTGDLLARMIQDADLGGNAFIARRPGRLVRLRPDWVTIVHGSYSDPDVGAWDPEAELLGYVYQPGGTGSEPVYFGPDLVAHFAPTPDPLNPAGGMSWITPLLREIEADTAATAHRLMYFRNGATPNLVVTSVPGNDPDQFQRWVDKFSKKHDGVRNAYKTMYLSGTADAKVVGNDLAQADFKITTGLGETRIAAAAGTPPVVVGLSEGLQGSSLNAGNFAASMRRFADLTGRPLWANACGSLASIVPAPRGSELFYDDRYIPALKDDIKDAAQVQSLNAQAIRQYIDAGFEPDAVVDAVNAGDLKRLIGRHSGLFSVQLQAPMPEGPEPSPGEPDADEEEPASE